MNSGMEKAGFMARRWGSVHMHSPEPVSLSLLIQRWLEWHPSVRECKPVTSVSLCEEMTGSKRMPIYITHFPCFSRVDFFSFVLVIVDVEVAFFGVIKNFWNQVELPLTQFINNVRGVLGPYLICAFLAMLKQGLELESLNQQRAEMRHKREEWGT